MGCAQSKFLDPIEMPTQSPGPGAHPSSTPQLPALENFSKAISEPNSNWVEWDSADLVEWARLAARNKAGPFAKSVAVAVLVQGSGRGATLELVSENLTPTDIEDGAWLRLSKQGSSLPDSPPRRRAGHARLSDSASSISATSPTAVTASMPGAGTGVSTDPAVDSDADTDDERDVLRPIPGTGPVRSISTRSEAHRSTRFIPAPAAAAAEPAIDANADQEVGLAMTALRAASQRALSQRRALEDSEARLMAAESDLASAQATIAQLQAQLEAAAAAQAASDGEAASLKAELDGARAAASTAVSASASSLEETLASERAAHSAALAELRDAANAAAVFLKRQAEDEVSAAQSAAASELESERLKSESAITALSAELQEERARSARDIADALAMHGAQLAVKTAAQDAELGVAKVRAQTICRTPKEKVQLRGHNSYASSPPLLFYFLPACRTHWRLPRRSWSQCEASWRQPAPQLTPRPLRLRQR